MSIQDHKPAMITGTAQGIGAGLVTAYRTFGHAVAATARTIGEFAERGHPRSPGRHRRPRHRSASTPRSWRGPAESTSSSTAPVSSPANPSPATPKAMSARSSA
jgi:NAD(P)-dependent dehydrogenase (short-subunit alcohol dehydrogenase family)